MHNLVLDDHSTSTPVSTAQLQEHSIFNYSTMFMKLAMLHRNFHDAIREGDGDRVTMIWKFLTILFFQHGHSKYGLILSARLGATLSSQKAEQLRCNRFVNSQGGSAKNIPLDLALEHLNTATKHDIRNLGANITPDAARRCSQSAHYITEILDAFDCAADVHDHHGRHGSVNTEDDFKASCEQLIKGNVMSVVPGRQYRCFPNFSHNVLEGVRVKKIYQWLDKHKRLIKSGGGDYL